MRSLRRLAKRPRGVLGRSRARDRLDQAAAADLRREAGVYGRWFPGRGLQHLLQRARPPCRGGRGDQAAIIYDSPVTGTKRRITYARAARRVGDAGRRAAGSRRRQGRPRHHLHADDPRGGRRACSPARASARCIRWCSAASPRRNWRPASTTPSRSSILTASCGIEPGRIVAYKPLLDAAIELSTHKPDSVLVLQRPQGAGAR